MVGGSNKCHHHLKTSYMQLRSTDLKACTDLELPIQTRSKEGGLGLGLGSGGRKERAVHTCNAMLIGYRTYSNLVSRSRLRRYSISLGGAMIYACLSVVEKGVRVLHMHEQGRSKLLTRSINNTVVNSGRKQARGLIRR